jgi:hypothetical protein
LRVIQRAKIRREDFTMETPHPCRNNRDAAKLLWSGETARKDEGSRPSYEYPHPPYHLRFQSLLSRSGFPSGGPGVNAFQQIPNDVRRDQIYRETLLAQPAEFFRAYIGRVPDLLERAHLVEKLIQDMAAAGTYANDIYCVRVRNSAPYVHLDISRRDEKPWINRGDFQKIKNELVGREYEAVELFPANNRLVDTANQYHLWVMADSRYRFPFGAGEQLIFDKLMASHGKVG